MEMFNGRCSRVSPANRALSCGSCALAYVVHVLLNAFVCTAGRTNHGEVSRGGCANAVRAGRRYAAPAHTRRDQPGGISPVLERKDAFRESDRGTPEHQHLGGADLKAIVARDG